MFTAAEWQQEEVLSLNGVKPTRYWNYNYKYKIPSSKREFDCVYHQTKHVSVKTVNHCCIFSLWIRL